MDDIELMGFQDIFPTKGESATELDPAEICHKITNLGKLWSDADAAAAVLEETKRIVLAKITIKYISESRGTGGKGITKIEAEQRALADPEYDTHVRAMVDARKIANHQKALYDASKVYVDLLRSAHATRRAEMTMR